MGNPVLVIPCSLSFPFLLMCIWVFWPRVSWRTGVFFTTSGTTNPGKLINSITLPNTWLTAFYFSLPGQICRSWVSVGDIMSKLRARNQRTVFRFPAGDAPLSLLQHHRTGSGFHTTSIQRDTESLSQALNRPDHEAGHSLSSSAKVKNLWSYASTPQYGMHKEKINVSYTTTC